MHLSRFALLPHNVAPQLVLHLATKHYIEPATLAKTRERCKVKCFSRRSVRPPRTAGSRDRHGPHRGRAAFLSYIWKPSWAVALNASTEQPWNDGYYHHQGNRGGSRRNNHHGKHCRCKCGVPLVVIISRLPPGNSFQFSSTTTSSSSSCLLTYSQPRLP